MVRIIISRTKQKKYYFTVESLQQESLLTSQVYASKLACKKGIVSLQNAVQGIGRYQWIEKNDNTISFIIKSINGQKLATSEQYNNLEESTDILCMLKAAVPKADVIDESH